MDDVTLTHTICHLLGGMAGWKYDPDPDADYTGANVSVWYGSLRLHGTGVAVRVYGGDDDDDLTVRRAQIRYRGDPHVVDSADWIADLGFHRLTSANVPGISHISRISFGPLGPDGNGREERSDNFQIILDNKESLTW